MSDIPYTLTSKAGQLNTVKRDAFGRILDGLHRKEVDPDWREETLDWIDTDRKFYAARLALNFVRRTMSPEELSSDLNKLATEILKEDGTRIGLITKLSEETGVRQREIRRFIAVAYKRTQKDVEIEPEAEADEPLFEAPELLTEDDLPETIEPPKTAEKGTLQREHQVHRLLAMSVGEHLDSLRKRLKLNFLDLTDEDVEYYIDSYRTQFPDTWELVYNADGSPKPRPEPVKSESDLAREDTSAPLFRPDMLMEDAMRWYPAPVIDDVWSMVGQNSKKLEFLKMLYEVLWDRIDPDEKMTLIQATISRMT